VKHVRWQPLVHPRGVLTMVSVAVRGKDGRSSNDIVKHTSVVFLVLFWLIHAYPSKGRKLKKGTACPTILLLKPRLPGCWVNGANDCNLRWLLALSQFVTLFPQRYRMTMINATTLTVTHRQG
jgi:hypothetical protein